MRSIARSPGCSGRLRSIARIFPSSRRISAMPSWLLAGSITRAFRRTIVPIVDNLHFDASRPHQHQHQQVRRMTRTTTRIAPSRRVPQADCLETLAAIMTNSSHPGKHPALQSSISAASAEEDWSPSPRRGPIDGQPLQLRHEEAPGDGDGLVRGRYGGAGCGSVSSGASGAIVMSMGEMHS